MLPCVTILFFGTLPLNFAIHLLVFHFVSFIRMLSDNFSYVTVTLCIIRLCQVFGSGRIAAGLAKTLNSDTAGL